MRRQPLPPRSPTKRTGGGPRRNRSNDRTSSHCVPNSVASDSSVENLSYPREAYRSELMVHVDPGAKPQWVEKILFDAVISTPGVLQDPQPVVLIQGVKEWSAEYSVRFFCADYQASVAVNAAAWRDIIRNLRYAGFESVSDLAGGMDAWEGNAPEAESCAS